MHWVRTVVSPCLTVADQLSVYILRKASIYGVSDGGGTARGNNYLRKDINFEVDGDDIVLPVTISMYEAGIDEPLVTYYEEIVPFDMTDDVGMLELDWYGYDIAVGSDGMVFIAPRSTEEALIVACDSAANEIRTLELPYEPTRRTEEEIEMERNILRAKAIASDENPTGLEPGSFQAHDKRA